MKRFLILFVSLILPFEVMADGKCKTGQPFPYEAPYEMESCPEDIQSWLDRANGCSYYEGELQGLGNDDADRSSVLDSHMVETECAVLWCDYDDLFAKYEGDIVYTGVLTEYAQSLYGDSELPACDPKSRQKKKASKAEE